MRGRTLNLRNGERKEAARLLLAKFFTSSCPVTMRFDRSARDRTADLEQDSDGRYMLVFFYRLWPPTTSDLFSLSAGQLLMSAERN